MSSSASALATVLGIFAALSACSAESDRASSATFSTEARTGQGASESSERVGSPSAATARNVSEENDLYHFEYAYPAAAAAIPRLRAELEQRLQQARSALAESARTFKADAQEGGFPYRPNSSGTTWKVVTDLPGWLSLSAELYSYSGGAHGMSNFNALLWDKPAGRAREPLDLFISPAALSNALQPAFCERLDRQRAEKRAERPPSGEREMFWECIDPVEQTVILGSSGGSSFDRIGVLVAPYGAGPYAEGSFEVTLPVTRAVLEAVKPEYRNSFAVAQ